MPIYRRTNAERQAVKRVNVDKHSTLIVLRILAYLLGGFGIIGTLVPFLRYDDYWIRGFDYPRQQLIFILALATLLWAVSNVDWDRYDNIILILLVSSMSYQTYRMLPYTSLWPVQAYSAQKEVTDETSLSLLVANVLQPNTSYDKVVNLVLEEQPDIFLSLESNKVWGEALHAGLDDQYPHHVSVPLENMYGMHLFSRRPLIDPEVKYRIKDDIPSIDAQIELGNGEVIDLYCLHPMPPSPTEAYASTGRDAELALVGLEVKEKDHRNAIVFGDMNDVAWSHSSRLFQRLSGLLDPRIGRGFFATFHAEHKLIRWPLDHVFHSTDLAIVDLRRLPYVGSDHFPVIIKFNYEHQVSEGQGDKPEDDDLQEADEVIEDGKKGKEDVVVPNT